MSTKKAVPRCGLELVLDLFGTWYLEHVVFTADVRHHKGRPLQHSVRPILGSSSTRRTADVSSHKKTISSI
jgi:hypothetical protein